MGFVRWSNCLCKARHARIWYMNYQNLTVPCSFHYLVQDCSDSTIQAPTLVIMSRIKGYRNRPMVPAHAPLRSPVVEGGVNKLIQVKHCRSNREISF